MNSKIHFGQEVASKLRQIMIVEAEKIAEKYPQYKGHFDNHLLVRANKELIGRYEKICDAGELLLADPEVLEFLTETNEKHQSICIWDMKDMTAKYVAYADIDFIEKRVKLTLQLDY